MGAAGATLGAYLVILAARGIHSRRLLRVAWHLPRFLLALGLLGLQCWGMYGGRFPLALACCAGVAALYARPLWRGITTGLRVPEERGVMGTPRGGSRYRQALPFGPAQGVLCRVGPGAVPRGYGPYRPCL